MLIKSLLELKDTSIVCKTTEVKSKGTNSPQKVPFDLYRFHCIVVFVKVKMDPESALYVCAVESLRGDGQMTAVEVIVIHYEEMGIQRDLAKMGIRQGMWGCVKKLEPGIRKYKAMRKLNKPLTPSALIAQISTKVPYPLNGLEKSSMSETENSVVVSGKGKDNESVEKNKGYMKWLLLGGAVAVACTVDRGAVGKFLVLGVAKRLGRVGRRM